MDMDCEWQKQSWGKKGTKLNDSDLLVLNLLQNYYNQDGEVLAT